MGKNIKELIKVIRDFKAVWGTSFGIGAVGRINHRKLKITGDY
jgi:hypothetical protein